MSIQDIFDKLFTVKIFQDIEERKKLSKQYIEELLNKDYTHFYPVHNGFGSIKQNEVGEANQSNVKNQLDTCLTNLNGSLPHVDEMIRYLYDNGTTKITKGDKCIKAFTNRILVVCYPDKFLDIVSIGKIKELAVELNKRYNAGIVISEDWVQLNMRLFEFLEKMLNLSCFDLSIQKHIISLFGWPLYCALCGDSIGNNVIYTGAPGTGKTYLARLNANKIVYGDTAKGAIDPADEHFCFVQFHPSMDYSDFVEGLRPIQNGSNINFELRDGIFLEFCRKALAKPDERFVIVIDEINRGDMSKIFGELFFSIDPNYRGKSGSVKTQYSNLWKDRSQHKNINGTPLDDYDISGKFYVPENVHIIGTMNDIDRSVESMDFAMRRRFIFEEITAVSRINDMFNEEYKNNKIDQNRLVRQLNNLNYQIQETEGLGSAYHIGPSYLLGLKKDDDINALWDKKLKGLLFEYLRGYPNVTELINRLQNAYFMNEECIDIVGNQLILKKSKESLWNKLVINK